MTSKDDVKNQQDYTAAMQAAARAAEDLKTAQQDVLFFKTDAKCDFPEPDGPKILTIFFIHRGQLFIKS